ncbi:uncharacterized protein PG986_005754 [Apiospora aurea]|uniref:2EXR domain-containing protein n=1 Tax=Apiospora aurea TaxID=335848 RepID=A0ABR1QJA1_9PEZI
MAWTSPITVLGMLKQLPPELRLIIYDHAMPRRILRVYRDWELKHVFIDALSVPDLALACKETWDFFRRKYTKFTYHPVWLRGKSVTTMESNKGDSKKGNDNDGNGHVGSDNEESGNEGNGTQSQSITHWTTELSRGRSWACEVLEALAGITQVTETLLYKYKHYDSLRLAMLPGLFPCLRKTLFAAYIKAVPDHHSWDRRRANFIQRNIIKRPGATQQRIKCTPPALSRFVDVGSYAGDNTKKESDRPFIEMWETKTFSDFSTRGCQERFPYSLPIHRDLVERQIAAAKHYWNTAYTVNADGSRVYPFYSDWERDLYANSPGVLACLPSVPEVVPVYLWMTG